jgi:hypothetical protein
LFGDGGSAADAQHVVAEFVGRFAFYRAALPAISLSVNGSCLTAIETPRIQEGHILLGHILCEIVEQELFDEKGRVSGS